ncbi:MAG: NYN domain-containing protein [Candidatus Staskawiczbacteria bacterium]|nr:NYN domain-containing protein [Candidatus Staskawiczbacteria bacterium]
MKDKKVLVLIDWDNLFICLCNRFGAEIRLEYRIQKLLEWVQSQIGEILKGYGFVFAPEHLADFYQKLCTENNLRLMICPKRQTDGKEEDTVDATLIWFARLMMRHPDVGYICLVAGDDDYVAMMKEAGLCGIKRVLAPPTIGSLSKNKKLVATADKHPTTLKKMLLRIDTL